eukprot:scaffold8792_cov63-Phaeocystis_antarctica.AAC.2
MLDSPSVEFCTEPFVVSNTPGTSERPMELQHAGTEKECAEVAKRRSGGTRRSSRRCRRGL